MTIFDEILLNLIHVTVPFLAYLVYIAYKKSLDNRENQLAIIFAIFSSLYFILKYNYQIYEDLPMLLINIPILILYYKNNQLAIIISTLVNILYYYHFYNNYLIIFIIIYALFYIIYTLFHQKTKYQTFAIIFTSALALLFLLITTITQPSANKYLNIIISTAALFITNTFLTCLLTKIEDILKIKKAYQNIEHEKQVKTTLFHITHEIKNPIAVCKGYLDMFDPNNQHHFKKYIPIMQEEINKTLNILEDFLSMNKIKLNKEPIDINYLLSDFFKNYEPYLKKNKVESRILLTDNEVYMTGDYNKLFQVLLNIIKNSIEAKKQNLIITVWTEIKDKQIYIYFQDNGTGIDKETLKKIGEPFLTTKINGTGLGVSLSKGIIEAHNGTLTYESELGKYTKVTITLPIEQWY